MSAYTTDQTSGIRPLAEAEVNEVNGGAAAVIAGVAVGLLVAGYLGYSITNGIRGNPLGQAIKAGAYDALH